MTPGYEPRLTILFTDIEGSTRLIELLGDEAAQDILRIHNRLVRQQVEKHGGREVKPTGDGFMVVFEDTQEAVVCATDVQREVERHNRANPLQEISVRIGIHAGKAISEEDDFFGLDVNLASRITSKASGGQILVSEAVRELAQAPGISFLKRGHYRLKGLMHRRLLFEVQWSEEPIGGRRPEIAAGLAETLPLTGRRTELTELRRYVAAMRSGRGAIVLVAGGPGVGKTRLVREAIASADSLGVTVLTARCSQAQREIPYGPLIRCLETYVKQTPSDLLREQVGHYGHELVELLPQTRQKLADIIEDKARAPKDRRPPLREALRSLLLNIAQRQPLLMFWDDLHWADPASISLARDLAAVAPTNPILVISAYRDEEVPHPLTTSLTALQRHPSVRRLQVKPLRKTSVYELLTSIGGQEPPNLLTEAIYWQTEGVPSAIDESLRRLAAKGALFDEKGDWRADVKLSDLGVPGVFSVIVGNRWRALPAPYRRAMARTGTLGSRVIGWPLETYILLAIVSGFAYLQVRELFYILMTVGLLGIVWRSFGTLRGRRTSLILAQATYLVSRLVGPNRRARESARGVMLAGIAAPFIIWLGWAIADDTLLGGPPRMGGDVNVLVTDFADRGQREGESSPESRQISLWLADSLENRFAAQLANREVAIRHLDSVIVGGEEALNLGTTHGADLVIYGDVLQRSGEEALNLGTTHGADPVIYGDVLQRSGGIFVTPRYYFTGRGTEELTPVELADLVGESSLGAPLGPIRLEEFLTGSEVISGRSEVVVTFTAGLVSLLAGEEEAVTLFKRTLELYGELELPESEVLHLFLAKALALDGTVQAYEQALPEFMAAIEINPEYARPYIGVAGWHYLQGAERLDADSLLEAVDLYEEAMVAPTRSPTPIIEAKGHLGKGNAYVVLAQLDDIKFAHTGRLEYQAVVELESECRGGLRWWDPRAWGPWKSHFESHPDYCPQLSKIVDAAEEGRLFLDDFEAGFVASVPSAEPSPRPEASPIGTMTPSPTAVAEALLPPDEAGPTPLPPEPTPGPTPMPSPHAFTPTPISFVGPPVLGQDSSPTPTPTPVSPSPLSQPLPLSSRTPTPTPYVPHPPTPTSTPPPTPTSTPPPTPPIFIPPVPVAVIDLFPGVVDIPVGFEPMSVSITPDGSEAYIVRNFSTAEVSVIDTDPGSPTWNTVTQQIEIRAGGVIMTVTPDGSEVWAAICRAQGFNWGFDVIDTWTKEVTWFGGLSYPIGFCPTQVAFTPDGSRGYATDSHDNDVLVVDTATRTWSSNTIPVGDQPVGIAITPDGNRAYVVNSQSDSVSVIDLSINQVINTIPVGDLPSLVVVRPDGSRAYITNRLSDSVSVIDTDPSSPTFNTVTRTLGVGDRPTGIAVSPDGRRAYVANSDGNNFSIIDTDPQSTTYHEVSGVVDAGIRPFGVAVTPDGCYVYVANMGSGDVTVLATRLRGCPILPPPTPTPTPTPTPSETPSAAAVAAGEGHTCALTTAGGVKCWGDNFYGQVGNGTFASSNSPADVLGLTSGMAAVAAGVEHTCALSADGGVECWGRNNLGQIGDGTIFNVRKTPVDVVGLGSGVVAVATGQYHTCALTEAGGVKCWGDNSYGQLGNGTTDRSATPVDVMGLGSGMAAVTAGYAHTCALTAEGGAKCWGKNSAGQLGDGTPTNRATPVDVVGLGSDVAAVAAGGTHTCALTEAGGVKCWGWNVYGALGDGTTNSSATPVDVMGLGSGMAAVTAGYAHTCALTAEGGAKCWGLNHWGQLGNGGISFLDPNPVPIDVVSLGSSVTVIDAGWAHTCAVTMGGGVKCWGRNLYGALGDGTTNSSATPVDVVGFEATGGSAAALIPQRRRWHR